MLYFNIDKRTDARISRNCSETLMKRLWNSFCSRESDLYITAGDENAFSVGNAARPKLECGSEYALNVTESGIAVAGKDFGGLMRGFCSLLMKIEHGTNGLRLPCVTEQGIYRIGNRMLHICIFPETDLYFAYKTVRLAGICGYTHLVLEFWGMLKYDCLKELSWNTAYTKDEIAGLISECRAFGMEPIPMFNHLGHASASRECIGKHVVLDQNPRLDLLFLPDGWVWNICSDETTHLLRRVRSELYELFGKGEFFHIGCDEARSVSENPFIRHEILQKYLYTLTREVEKEGRRPMVWMDMFLEEGRFEHCYASGKADDIPLLRGALSDSTVFVDWQYDSVRCPIPSLFSLKDSGHDCIGAPWNKKENYTACVDTVAENGLFGIMQTTWHTLSLTSPGYIVDCAKKCGTHTFGWSQNCGSYDEIAVLMRRVSFEGNTYESAGWLRNQIEF